jgi:hypothetical protein
VSVRGNLRRSLDGYVHHDLSDKIISVLLFRNETWKHPGGRLRVLRSRNVEDYALEIFPELGSILIFRRSNRAWHGKPALRGSAIKCTAQLDLHYEPLEQIWFAPVSIS